jgi:hypothetical protein
MVTVAEIIFPHCIYMEMSLKLLSRTTKSEIFRMHDSLPNAESSLKKQNWVEL